jgi:hypothetical protein
LEASRRKDIRIKKIRRQNRDNRQQHVDSTSTMAATRPKRPRLSPTKKQWRTACVAVFLGVVILHPFWAFHVLHADNDGSSNNSFSLTATNNTFAATRTRIERPIPESVDAVHVPGCLAPACIDYQAAQIARAFSDRTDQAWCIRPSNDTGLERHENNWSKDSDGQWRGILLVKVPKGASSTSAGVAIRISRRHNCKAVEWSHRMATEYAGRSRTSTTSTSTSREPTFLFTTIRNPSARAISTVFFHVVSRTNSSPTDEFITTHLRYAKQKHLGAVSEGQGGFQLRYTSLTEIPEHSAWNAYNKTRVQNPRQVMQNVRNTVNNYDFIIVTERMDESLVAMALSLGLDVGDVLVTASKVAGSRYHFARYAHNVLKCLPTVKSFVGKKVQEFLDSDEWRAMNYGDLLLHQAANQSLDRTIERLGRDRLDRALTKYRRLQALETEQCAQHVNFPCSNEGEAQPKLSKRSCYLPFFDFGCGYKCIDKLIENYREEDS